MDMIFFLETMHNNETVKNFLKGIQYKPVPIPGEIIDDGISNPEMFREVIIDMCFVVGYNRAISLVKELTLRMTEEEKKVFCKSFLWMMEVSGLTKDFPKDKIGKYNLSIMSKVLFLEARQHLIELPKFLIDHGGLQEVKTPLFQWRGDYTKLVELIFFLSERGWIKVNPDLRHIKTLAERLSETFGVLDNAKKTYVPMSSLTLQKYFEGIDIAGINSISEEGIYEFENDKVKPQKTSTPFRGVKPLVIT